MTTTWTDGKTTVEDLYFKDEGGSGSKIVTITATDSQSDRSGSCPIALDVTQEDVTAYSGDVFYAFRTVTGYPPQPSEWQNYWYEAQTEAQSYFDADESMDAESNDGAYRYVWGGGDETSACIYGGWVLFYLTEEQRDNAVGLVLRGSARATEGTGASWSSVAHLFDLQVQMTESNASFSSGGDLSSHICPDVTKNFVELNQAQQANGNSPDSPGEIDIRLPVSFLSTMSGYGLFLWVYIPEATIPYAGPGKEYTSISACTKVVIELPEEE